MKVDTLFADDLAHLSRRDFIRKSGVGLLALFGLPFLNRYERFERLNPAQGSSSILVGRGTDDTVPVFDRPSFSAKLKRMYYRDVIFKIDEVTIGDDEPAYNRVWYRVNNEGYAHSGKIQPVELHLNQPASFIPSGACLAEVSVPFTDVAVGLKDTTRIAYRFYYSTVHWVTGVQKTPDGESWYLVNDDKFKETYYVRAKHLRLLDAQELTPLSPNLAAEDRRIEVWREDQLVLAYEKDQPVMITKAATGGRFSDGDYTTPSGNYITSRKRPSRHMASEDLAAANSYDLPGVPWVSYITRSGISFHGTFWHNDFGKPRSHGCINLSPSAARWIYRWTQPAVPFELTTVEKETGTRVIVL
jgi:hypothetical protein